MVVPEVAKISNPISRGNSTTTVAPPEVAAAAEAEAEETPSIWQEDEREFLLRQTELAAEAAANAATVAKEAADRAIGVRNTLMGARKQRSRHPSALSGGSKDTRANRKRVRASESFNKTKITAFHAARTS